MTIADLCLYSFLTFLSGCYREDTEPGAEATISGEGEPSHYLDDLPDTLLDDYPALLDLKRQVEELPAVASFRSKFQRPYSTFTFRPT